MKKIFAVTTILVLLVATVVFAAEMNSRQNRQRQRVPICSKVLNSQQEIFTGTMANIGKGTCIVLELEDETQVKIYGLGPSWYWESFGMEKPGIGDVVTITAYAVPFLDATRYVAASVTTADGTIQLRDEGTGCPLWLGYNRQ
jgi:preprotein translocase subunit YajC